MNQVSKVKIPNRKVKLDVSKLIFWFVTIDLFFMPYYNFMAVTISAPILMIWVLFHLQDYLRGKEACALLILILSMMGSTFLGLFWDSSVLRYPTDNRTTILRFIQYFLCFGYYFYYKRYFAKNRINLSKVIFVAVIYITFFAVLFMLFPRQYGELKIRINPADNHTRRYLANEVIYRFNYLWTDPNNIAYLLDGLVFFYVLDKKNTMRNKIIITVLASISILATASNGGMLTLAMVFACLLFMQIIAGNRIKTRAIATIIVAMIIGLLILRFTNIGSYVNNNLVMKLTNRFNLYRASSNVSGGRLHDLFVSFQYFNPVFLLIGSGKEGFTSENGHMYWICMYGLPSYLAFMYVCFAKYKRVRWIKYIWILPFFVCFTINIGIGEFKLMSILLMLMAYSRYSITEDKSSAAIRNN